MCVYVRGRREGDMWRTDRWTHMVDHLHGRQDWFALTVFFPEFGSVGRSAGR